MNKPAQEAEIILSNLIKVMPDHIHGREAIVEMRDGGSPNWRQMEWIGFWFEHLVDSQLKSRLGVSIGPSVGRTKFDLEMNHVWDLKVHPQNSTSKNLILNDKDAVDSCIDQFGGFGFVVVVGDADYDQSGEFKVWHDHLKGGKSDYELERIKRGAPSRRRKVGFHPKVVEAVFFAGREELSRGLEERWLSYFQTGMRNSNGVARRPKYQINLDKTPSEFVLAKKIL
jgi:hypothetical protein